MTQHHFYKRAWFVLLFLLVCRVLAMCIIPLNDTTEARYGEIARIMLETGDWTTPMQSIGMPFWAKPPLSIWLSAVSMMLFGVNECAARLPSLLLSIGVLWLVWGVSNHRNGRHAAVVSMLVLAGSFFFFLNAGTVMTDPSLVFCTTLTLVAFWHALIHRKPLWGYWFFVGLGLGLLAKGPIVLVLTGLPIFIWVVCHNQWGLLWRALPWVKGSVLMLLIATPWYVLAEMKTPGFLEYFILGEHVKRFLDPGWSGDHYGFAHKAHYGMIWVYAFIGVLPWSIAGIIWFVPRFKTLPRMPHDTDGWRSYLLISTLMPLMFFTFSSNIIYPYVFPSIPFFALFFSECLYRLTMLEFRQRHILCLTMIPGLICLFATALFVFKPEWVDKSQKRIARVYRQQSMSAASRLIYWSDKTDFSAQFYSKGTAISTLDASELRGLLSHPVPHVLVLNSKEHRTMPQELCSQLRKIMTVYYLGHQVVLYRND